ncbi:MAG: glycosyltransferase [Bacteroidales bacterium]|nr:glycosyltransferase [Bacteroidales bacterium]
MKKWIICSGPDWFRPSVTSTRQIAFQFRKKGYNVLWVNPVAFKSPSVNSDNKKSKRKKIVNKLKTHLKLFKKVDEGLYVFIPLYIPVFSPGWDSFNARLMKVQMSILSLILGFRYRDSILWISGSFTLSPLLGRQFKLTVYQAADLISDFRTTNKSLLADLRKKELHLSTGVDHLFASSPNIQKKLQDLSGREVNLLTHGVDFEHFTRQVKVHPRMVEIKSKGLPVAGYFGTLSDANDKEVFRILSENGFSVVIIGKVLGDYSMLESKENIYFTGPVEFSELPAWAGAFDVCLLNWVMADWIKNSFPVKTLEYLAMGKPVVSCRIPVVEQMFGNHVYFADTPQDFLLQARAALTADSEKLQKERTGIAATHTWDSKFQSVCVTLGLND